MFKVTITTNPDTKTRLLFIEQKNINDIVNYFNDHPSVGSVEVDEITYPEAGDLDLERTKEEVNRAMDILDLVYPY